MKKAIENLKELINNYKKSGIPTGGLEEVVSQLIGVDKMSITERLPEDENEEVLVFWHGVTGINATTANCEQHKDKPRWYDYKGQEINTSNYQITHWSKIN